MHTKKANSKYTIFFAVLLSWFLLCQSAVAALVADDLWKVEAGDSVDSILLTLFPDKPHLRTSLQSIVYKLNTTAFDATTGMLKPGSILRVPGAKWVAQAEAKPEHAVQPAQPMNKSKPVGQVLVAMGDISATDSLGNIRKLQRKSPIYEGDFVATSDDSKTQLRFSDGALLALRPNTQFKIETYRYEGKQDGQESGIFSLIKGGFRTITGYIGSSNKQNYRVKTPVATIGIRGTHYGLRLCDANDCGSNNNVKNGLYGGVVDGGITVANKAGERVFNNDQYFHVASDSMMPKGIILPPGVIFDGAELKLNTARFMQQKQQNDDNGQVPEHLRHKDRAQQTHPQRGAGGNPMQTAVTTHLATNQPGVARPAFIVGQDTTQFTDTAGSSNLDLPPLPGNAAAPGAAVAVSFLHQETVQGTQALVSGAGAIIADGTLDHMILLDTFGNTAGHIPVGIRNNEVMKDRRFSRGDAVLRNVGADTNIGVNWGRWEGAYRLTENDQALTGLGSLHFMHSPNTTSASVLNNLGPLGTQVGFSVAGSTQPTDHLGNTGTLLQAQLMVDFVSRTILDYFLQVKHSEDVYTGYLALPVLFDNLLSAQSDIDPLQLNGDVCVSCQASPVYYPLQGSASLVFLDEGNIPANAAMSTFSLTTNAFDPQLPAPAMGTSGAILFKRDPNVIPR